jgi:TetR/AcrR family transcriptional regulator, transcriptional repressor for nem operon
MGAGGTTSRAARLTPKGRATRERIVEVAARLMFERGVALTSTEDVQAEARVSASQLYHYFTDKRSLVRAVIAHLTERVLGAQQAVLSRLDSIEALEAWRDLLVANLRSRDCQGGCAIGSLASELADVDPDARADLVAGFGRWEGAIRDGLRAMRDRGELRPDADPDELALATLAAVEGGYLLTQLRRDTAPLEAALNTVIDRIASLRPT